MENTCTVNARELTDSVVALVRAFGLHRPDQTPCGQPIAVAEAHALMDLARFAPMNQAELASRLRLEKSTISRLVRQMETRGWIQRATGIHDARVREIRLAKEGKKTAAALAQARERKFAGVLARIPREEQAMVIGALSLLAEASL
jgi:DNA-binding MarR family transcriptional regulator